MKARWTKFYAIAFSTLTVASGAWADALDNWFVRNSGTTNLLSAAAYGDGNFVVVGKKGTLLTSTNGTNWVGRSVDNSVDFWCVGYGNGVFVAAGGPKAQTNILVSTNTIDWLPLVPSSTNDSIHKYTEFYGSSYCGGVHFLVGSSGVLLTASNIDLSCAGQPINCNWTLRDWGSAGDLGGVAYGNGVFVAVGGGVTITSTNAVNWTRHYFPSAGFTDVIFAAEKFVGVGYGSYGIKTSSNGVSWTPRVGSSVSKVAYGNGTFVAVAYSGIATSTDGISWRWRALPSSARLAGVTYGNGTFILTGFNGLILQSPSVSVPILSVARHAPSGGIDLGVDGEIGRGYRVQVSTNLAAADWEDFLSFTNAAPTMQFLDTSVTNLPARFYRAVSP